MLVSTAKTTAISGTISVISTPVSNLGLDSPKPTRYSEQTKNKQTVNNKPKPSTTQSTAKVTAAEKKPMKPKPAPKPAVSGKVTDWLWPTKGRVVVRFSNAEQGNKGIDIAGRRGQPVVATAKGAVVYAGNALRGYGNLIIIKHNDDYLSAYAHNERILVKENQRVAAGEQIATMGSSGSQDVRLHFEIRYKGKSVNPQRYLP